MSLQGLPDFSQPLYTANSQTFYGYENAANGAVVPQSIAPTDFSLTLVRGQNPIGLPKPHGLLNLRLQPVYPLTEALEAIRSQNPSAIVQPLLCQSGFLRLYSAIRTETIPDDLKAPMPLAWNGLTLARYSLSVSESTAVTLKGALQGNILKLMAAAEMEIAGVAPRLPLQVRFDPAVLLDHLAALGDAQRQVPCEAILNFFRGDVRSLPLEILPSENLGEIPLEGFAETLTDWVRANFGRFIPCPTDELKPHVALATANRGSVLWDLSQPLLAYRTIVMVLNPLAAAQQLVQTQGLDAVFQELTVPPIPTGTWPVFVTANLSDQRPGIVSIGVTLKAPSVVPFRPQARIVSAEFIPPADSAQLWLKLSPAEKLTYTFSTSVVLQDDSGVQQFYGEEIAHSGEYLSLQPGHFPVRFIPLEATPSLLKIATIKVICHWQEGEVSKSQSIELQQNAAAITLTLPKSAIAATLELSAHSLDGTQSLSIPPMLAKNCQIGLHSFREFGTHQIEVECKFSDGTTLYAIDLLPEAAPVSAASVLFFTPAQPRKTWSWLATSPFQAGYRYRRHPAPEEPPAPWSETQSPFAALKIYS
jgi:hypothetical protein